MLHAKHSSPLVSARQSHLGCLAAALCQQVDGNPLIDVGAEHLVVPCSCRPSCSCLKRPGTTLLHHATPVHDFCLRPPPPPFGQQNTLGAQLSFL